MAKVFEAWRQLNNASGDDDDALQRCMESFASRHSRRGGHITHAAASPAEPDSRARLLNVPLVSVGAANESRIASLADPLGAGADQFRLLRMRLVKASSGLGIRKFLITSAQARDGKTTVVLNLATALCEATNYRVLVIDADLRRSSIRERLALPDGPGLTDVVRTHVEPWDVVRRIKQLGWYYVGTGSSLGNPTELLHCSRAGHTIGEWAAGFDFVLIDCPPVLPLTDTVALQAFADASVLVVRAGVTPRGKRLKRPWSGSAGYTWRLSS